MRKVLLTLLPLFALSGAAFAQFDGDPSTKPAAMAEAPQMKPIKGSPELKKLARMVGNYRVTGKTFMSGKEEKLNGTSRTYLTTDGAWVASDEVAMVGKTKMVGHLRLSYDAMSKSYMGYWFDNFGGYAIPMKGDYQDDKLVMNAEGVHGMPPMTVTMSVTKRGGHMEMTMGGQPAMSLDYIRVAARKPRPKAKAKPKAAAPAVVPPAAAPKVGG